MKNLIDRLNDFIENRKKEISEEKKKRRKREKSLLF